VLRLQPQNQPAWNNRCWFKVVSGDAAAALPDCTQALVMDPHDAAALDSMGYVRLKLRAYALSVSSYSAALKADPTLASSWYGRALAEQALGQGAAAQADFARAAKLDPDIASDFGT